jgi:hypothetical protein
VQTHEIFAELRGGATGGRSWIVELVHETGSESAEGGHLLFLNGHALEFLHAIGHIAEDGFADIWATGHEVPERFFVELSEAAVGHGAKVGGVRDVGKQGNFPECKTRGHGGDHELLTIAAGLVDAYLAFQENPKKVSRLTLTGEKLACIEANLFYALEAANLIVFERGQDGRLSHFCKEGPINLVLDDLGLVAHG